MVSRKEHKIFDRPPAAEHENATETAENGVVWVAQYESSRFQFMATGLTSYMAHCALIQGLRDHARQYELSDEWFYLDDITVTCMIIGQTLRDREVIRV